VAFGGGSCRRLWAGVLPGVLGGGYWPWHLAVAMAVATGGGYDGGYWRWLMAVATGGG